jgi:arylsulfatase A-like enzyme
MKYFALVLCLVSSSLVQAAQPNVVIILADDLGWSDTSLYGTTTFYQTPNIERLAKRGMTFTRAYSASPLCSPTRSALLTGLSPARTGITTPNCHRPQVVLKATPGQKASPDQKAIQPKPATRLLTEFRTLAETLKDAGYATAHFGKWHLGPDPYSPLQQGFDLDLPHHAGPGPAGSYIAPWKFADFKQKSPTEHIEDRMAAEAVTWMEQQKDTPFFLNYWMFSVHAPFDAKRANIEKHRDRIDPNDAQRSPTYAAMIQSMDDAIGTLLDGLDRLGHSDNTIIIFTADNGGNMYNEVDGTIPTSNRPLRGGKATMFEGGTRVPGIVVWPSVTPLNSRSDATIQSEDFYPTLLEGLSLKVADGQRFDGSSILPAFRGDSLHGKAVFQYFPHSPGVPDWLPPSVSVHRDEWKLIRVFYGGEKSTHRFFLFNLRDDLGEKKNLADAEPELVKELDALIENFLVDTEAVVPTPNPDFDASRYRPELEGVQADRKKAKAASADSVWMTSKDAAIVATDNKLVLTSSGKDPWISTTKIPKQVQGPFKLSLRLRSDARGEGRIYFSASKSSGFSKEQSVQLSILHDGEIHDYEVAFPEAVKNLTALRIDPATAPGQITIEQFGLIDASGKCYALKTKLP